MCASDAEPYWCEQFQAAGWAKADANRVRTFNDEWTYNGVGTKVRFGGYQKTCSKAGAFYCAGGWHYGTGHSQAAAVKRAVGANGLHPGTSAAGRGQCSIGTVVKFFLSLARISPSFPSRARARARSLSLPPSPSPSLRSNPSFGRGGLAQASV